jgi:hypothetical protein
MGHHLSNTGIALYCFQKFHILFLLADVILEILEVRIAVILGPIILEVI